MSQLSNEGAEEIIRFSLPVMGGMAVMVGSGLLLELTASLSDKTQMQTDISGDIAVLESEVNTLESANKLVNGDESIINQIEVRESQIAELGNEKNALGNETLNFGEAYGLPILLGATVAFVGIKRAISKSSLFPNKS